MPLPEQKPGTVANIKIKIKEKVAQNWWPILAQFNWPLTPLPSLQCLLRTKSPDTRRLNDVMYQHFSGHTVKPLYAAIRNLRATYSHWPD
jgi:hypothetical protein